MFIQDLQWIVNDRMREEKSASQVSTQTRKQKCRQNGKTSVIKLRIRRSWPFTPKSGDHLRKNVRVLVWRVKIRNGMLSSGMTQNCGPAKEEPGSRSDFEPGVSCY